MSAAVEDKRAVVPAEGQLPELRTSMNVIDRTKPLPTSLQSDFIPEDVLFALTQPAPVRDLLGPPTRTRNLSTTNSQPRPPPSNLWSHKRRDKFKHLTDHTPCVCGAGNDISFLYDVPKTEKGLERPERFDKSSARKEPSEKPRKPLQLPDTLIPEEYHIVKNRGVMGIEFHEDKYSTQVSDHEKHLVVFPSMNPASRFEVLQLRKTLDNMLEKAGVFDADGEIKGPTQMHNLMELIKKEQNIYNIVFHELIRQTSVECVERGELLADLRLKYSELLNKVPQQIKSLHEEVMAQRALDRRLTEELLRFKSTISVLTSELSSVKEHDRKVTREAQKAQEDLKTALSEAQKNASLLTEYHDLYELQRKRLESQVFMLTEERELWSQAAYSLALKVTEEANLTTAKRLHVSEKSWAKLAAHFTILLSDKDTELLTRMQSHVEKWRDLVEEFNITLKVREDDMRNNIQSLRSGIEQWMREIRNVCLDEKDEKTENGEKDENASEVAPVTPVTRTNTSLSTREGHFIKPPDEERLKVLLSDIRKWEDVLGKESEKFGGDTLLNGQEQLTKIRRQMDGWTDNALRVFGRHRKDPMKNHPDHESMNLLNEEVDELLKQFNNRITGENGVAPNAIHLLNGLETWDMKMASALNGTMPIHDNEWGQFYQLMEEWLNAVDGAVEYVGMTQSEEDRADGKPHTRIEVSDTIRKVQKWMAVASNSIDSEDARLVEQVATLHSSMVRWMVQMLLRLAPDWKDNSKEASDLALLGSAPLSELHSNVKTMFEQLQSFSNYISLRIHDYFFELEEIKKAREAEIEKELKAQDRKNIFSSKIMIREQDIDVKEVQPKERQREQCCGDIVMENTQIRRDNMEENPDHELKDLQRLRHECDDWIRTAQVMTSQLLGESIASLFPLPAGTEDKSFKSRLESIPTDPEIAYHDKEKLHKTPETKERPAQPEEPADKPAEETKEGDKPEEAPAEGETKQEPEEAAQEEKKEEPSAPAEAELEKLEVIGQDDNTHVQKFDQKPEKPVPPVGPPPAHPVGDAPDTHKAFEALTAVDSLQEQLIATEERAQKAEERASEAESKLAQTEEKMRELERRLAKLEPDSSSSPSPEKTSPQKTASPTQSPSKDATESKDEKKARPESQASKGSSKSSKKKK